MRRLVVGVLFVAVCLSGTGAGAAPPPGRGPACADIVGVSGSFYQSTESSKAKITAKVKLADDGCRQFSYTLHVVDGTTTNSIPVSGDGTTLQSESVLLPTGVSSACVYVTSSVGNHVFDRAPASGCIVLEAGDNPDDYEWFP